MRPLVMPLDCQPYFREWPAGITLASPGRFSLLQRVRKATKRDGRLQWRPYDDLRPGSRLVQQILTVTANCHDWLHLDHTTVNQ